MRFVRRAGWSGLSGWSVLSLTTRIGTALFVRKSPRSSGIIVWGVVERADVSNFRLLLYLYLLFRLKAQAVSSHREKKRIIRSAKKERFPHNTAKSKKPSPHPKINATTMWMWQNV